jgi:hypothetical protein
MVTIFRDIEHFSLHGGWCFPAAALPETVTDGRGKIPRTLPDAGSNRIVPLAGERAGINRTVRVKPRAGRTRKLVETGGGRRRFRRLAKFIRLKRYRGEAVGSQVWWASPATRGTELAFSAGMGHDKPKTLNVQS